MLKIYFDGSGKDDSQSPFLTLAGFAGDKDAMDRLEDGWLAILNRHHPGLKFFHMSEALAPNGYFQKELGWDLAKVLAVADDLNILLSEMPKERLCGFRYTVDLTAYRKWRSVLKLPMASKKCAHEAFAKVYHWYCGWSNQMIAVGPIELFYDRNENFLRHVYKTWCHPERNREFWGLVKTVAPVISKETPPVQSADLLAWSANRIRIGPRHEDLDKLCWNVLQNGAATWNADIDEGGLIAEYGRTIW